jgi:hypothetical protein
MLNGTGVVLVLGSSEEVVVVNQSNVVVPEVYEIEVDR